MMLKKFAYAICLVQFTYLASCASPTGTHQGERAAPPGVQMVLTHRDDIRESPSTYIDKTVMVQGTVSEILSPNAFILEHGPIFRRNQMLIFESDASRMNVTRGSNVEVVGDVKLFNPEQLQREHNITLRDVAFDSHRHQAAIFASTIRDR